MPASVSGRHPEDRLLLDVAMGRTAADSRGKVQRHASRCLPCRRRLSSLERLATAVREEFSVGEEMRAMAVAEPVESGGAGRRPPFAELARLSDEGLSRAEVILEAAARGPDELSKAFDDLRGANARPWTLLLASQRAARLATQEPRAAGALAERVAEEAGDLPTAGEGVVVSRELVRAEAALLASQAMLNVGRVAEAVERARAARSLFAAARDAGFGEPLCDYFEGVATSYLGEFPAAMRLLKRSLSAFARFGQEAWIGRAEVGVGLVLGQRGDDRRALTYLERALARLDPDEDAHTVAAALINQASSLAHLDRFDESRAAYGRARVLTFQHGLRFYGHQVELGLAELDFLMRDWERAFGAFERLAEDARRNGYEENVTFSRLFMAECLARMGRPGEMARVLDALRAELPSSPFRSSLALVELFACLDQGDVDAGLVAHVRTHLEELAEGRRPEYRRYRQAG